ncbi:hypothetical protein PYW07_006911 [Mythimna separata]|uniref:Uncharacterized protein n=1 Tax=Mythimna separata TaxID=271217 RepID=A0AAD7Z222_MYTSE|nr:hypothetical protein PYW07_006911 [Mythimna separata]
MSRCVNCSLMLVQPLPRRQIKEATESMIKILQTWISPTTVSKDDVICRECYIILEKEAGNFKKGTVPAHTFGHLKVCLGCGKSVTRARTHAIPLNSRERNFILAHVPPHQVKRLETVCLACWSKAYRTVRKHAELDQSRGIKSEESAVKSEEPAIKSEEPAIKSEEPAIKKEEPAIKKEEPAIKKEEPAVKKEEPAITKKAPRICYSEGYPLFSREYVSEPNRVERVMLMRESASEILAQMGLPPPPCSPVPGPTYMIMTPSETVITPYDKVIRPELQPPDQRDVASQTVTSTIYKRAGVPPSSCIFKGCDSDEYYPVSIGIKELLLLRFKLYVPPAAKICKHHFYFGDWKELHFYDNDFTGAQMDDMMKIMESGSRRGINLG